METVPTRREFLTGAVAVSVGGGGLAGCVDDFEDPEATLDALVAACSEPMVFLSAWTASYPDGARVSIDVAGGSVLVYWIDDDGVVCHGEPGDTG